MEVCIDALCRMFGKERGAIDSDQHGFQAPSIIVLCAVWTLLLIGLNSIRDRHGVRGLPSHLVPLTDEKSKVLFQFLIYDIVLFACLLADGMS